MPNPALLLGLLLSLLLGLLGIGELFAHSGSGISRYVAVTGTDQGDCDNVVRPCRTIAYAAKRAIKGDKILVALGTYRVDDPAVLFYLMNTSVPVLGGYNRFDMYLSQNREQHHTRLVGVPHEYAGQLEDNGFYVQSDIKSLKKNKIPYKKFQAMKKTAAHMNTAKSNEACINGKAGIIYGCSNVDLLAHMPFNEFSSKPMGANDIWGLLDLNDGREYAIVCLNNGVAVVDVTDPTEPREVGTVTGDNSYWRDVKVHQYYDHAVKRWRAYAYATADDGNDGVTIIDLSNLPNSISKAGQNITDRTAHNIYISNVDYSTGVALDGRNPYVYIAGSSASNGFRAYGLNAADNLNYVTKSPYNHRQNYIHDASSFIAYSDACNNGQGCEVLVDFNENEAFLWNVENKAAPTILSDIDPPSAYYIHSGWPSEDGRYLFVHDELDEYRTGGKTQLHVFDIQNLSNPQYVGKWQGSSSAIDHNGYVRGNRYYMSSYAAGLVILDISDPVNPVTAGYFDTFPILEGNSFNGAWGVYPFLPSGTVLVNDINSGLYILRDNTLSSPQGQLGFSQNSFTAEEGYDVQVPVRRRNGSDGMVTVAYEARVGTAGVEDYQLAKGKLTWQAGDTEDKIISIPLIYDEQEEAPETFFIRLYDPTNGATLVSPSQSMVHILENPGPGTVGFSSAELEIQENQGRVVITANREGGDYGDLDIAFNIVPVTALAGEDYHDKSGVLHWDDGDLSSKSFEINLINDDKEEADKTFHIILSSLDGDSSLVSEQSILAVTIKDILAPTRQPQLMSPLSLSGHITSAHFSGGATRDNGASFETLFNAGDEIDVLGTIAVEQEHIGEAADIYVIAIIEGMGWFSLKSNGGLVPWNLDVASLKSLMHIDELSAEQSIEILSQFKGVDGGATTRRYHFFIGYSPVVNENEIYYNGEALSFRLVKAAD